MRVLVVDDERRLASSLRVGLEAEGFAVDLAHDGTDGLWMARENTYDAIVLDLMLPGINGYKVCETLRAEQDWTPILMLTAKDGEWDQVEGLDTGADDYLTKPFSFPVLVARLRAVVRRGARERPTQLEAGDLRLDPAARGAWRGDVELELTAREFSLLVLPGAAQGRRRLQAADPRGGVGRRLRGRPQHRRGLRAPPAQQDRPALRPRGDRDAAGSGLPAEERRWLRAGCGARLGQGPHDRRRGPRGRDRPAGGRLRAGQPGAGLAARRARDRGRAACRRRSPTRSRPPGCRRSPRRDPDDATTRRGRRPRRPGLAGRPTPTAPSCVRRSR